MKTLEKIKARPHVMAVDDERGMGNSLIVTLNEPYCFQYDPGCGVRGFDTVAEAEAETRANKVYQATGDNPPK